MRLAACLAVGVLLAGCDPFAEPMPLWVVNRQPLDPCADGVVEADSPEADAGQTCILDAFRAGRGAELVTASAMETGDAMTSYVRVHANGTIEMFLNFGSDHAAPGAWERFRCETLAPADADTGPVVGVFTLSGCEQLPIP